MVMKMEDTRKYGRFDTQLKAHYFLEKSKSNLGECTVVNMSRKGVRVRLHTPKDIGIGTTISLNIFVPEKMNPTSVMGVIKWINKKGNDFICGIECDEILDEMRFSKVG